jgi:uncharacterized membrane protein
MMVRPFALALLSIVVLDALWLGVVARDFYRQSLAPLARMADGGLAPIWPIAALVYPVLALGLTVFVVSRSGSAREAALLGALFGAITFAVYDLTNHATLRDWRAAMTLVDIAWGASSCAAASWVAATFGK